MEITSRNGVAVIRLEARELNRHHIPSAKGCFVDINQGASPPLSIHRIVWVGQGSITFQWRLLGGVD